MEAVVLDQQELDLAGETVESRWNVLAQQEAVNWTDEALCIAWCWPKSDWRAHKEWWDHLPNYEKQHLLGLWKYERFRVPQGSYPMSLEACLGAEEDHYNTTKQLAEHWAKEIRAAAKLRQPVPITPAPGFEYVLDWACELAGVLVISSNK